jgi:hypothetical protein
MKVVSVFALKSKIRSFKFSK